MAASHSQNRVCSARRSPAALRAARRATTREELDRAAHRIMSASRVRLEQRGCSAHRELLGREIRQTLTSAGEAVKADAELLRWFLAATTESRSGDASFTCVDKPSESEVANAIQAFRTQLTERRAQLKQQEQQVLAQLEAVAHEVNGLQPLPHTQRGQLTKLVQSLAVLPETPTADAHSTSFGPMRRWRPQPSTRSWRLS